MVTMFAFLAAEGESGGWLPHISSLVILLLIFFFLYIFYAVTLMLIARRTYTPGAGMAWIPIANLVLMCRIARRPAWWVVMCLIPVLNLPFFIMLWMSMAQACGKSLLVGVLAVVPVIGLLVPIYLALTAKPPVTQTLSSNCSSCNNPIVPGEGFCRQCGQAAPTVVRVVARQTSAGKLFIAAAGVSLTVFIFLGVFGWFSLSSALAYTPPDRQEPEIPERTAGTLTEFPIDTDASSPTEPGSVIIDNTQSASDANIAASNQTPQKRLPPGVTRDSLKKRATTVTSVVQRRKGKTPEPADVEIYISVLRIAPGQTKVGEALATDIAQTSKGTRTGTRVQSSKGGTYTGSRISTPQINVYVLEKQGSDIVILIYSPTPAGSDTAARLAGNVGNGEGIKDYPSIKTTLWTLPQNPPNLTLIDFMTKTQAEMWSSEIDLNKAKTDEDTEKLLEYFKQFTPERAATARYRDGQGRLWEVGVYDYETVRKAWNIWLILKWTVGLNAESASVKNASALYMDTDDGRVLIFQRGMYLVIIQAPKATPVENIAGVGNSVQV